MGGNTSYQVYYTPIHLHHENRSEQQDVDFHVLLAEPVLSAVEVLAFHVLLAVAEVPEVYTQVEILVHISSQPLSDYCGQYVLA